VPFAEFRRAPTGDGGRTSAAPLLEAWPPGSGARSGEPLGSDIEVERGIYSDSEFVGTVFIRSDTVEIAEDVTWLAYAFAAIATAVLAIAAYLSTRLQSIVSRPILGLVDAMKAVSERQDYTIRARVDAEDEIGALAQGFNEMLSRIDEQKGRLAVLAHFDTLTLLPNRTLCLDRLHQAIQLAARTQQEVAVLFIDLDGFKDVNDTYGHRVGDLLLQEVAGRLTAVIRGSDTLARLGGDEFVVVAQNVASTANVLHVVTRITDALKPSCHIEQLELAVTASIGVALYPDDGTTVDDLLRAADTAMYQAKKDGKDGFRLFAPELHEEALRRITLVNELRRAIHNDEFVLYYQPQFDIATRALTGFEALVRWQHPTRGLVSPGSFIPIAEESGPIDAIGEWVFRRACRQLKAWIDEGLEPPTVAVNVSARQLRYGSAVGMAKRVLGAEGIAASLLELEITESALMRDIDESHEVIVALKKMGFSIAIDDLGTGHSSLAQLRRIPVDRVKIDRTFLLDVPGNAHAEAILAALIGVARSLDLKVTAEGVETPAQPELLARLGCHDMQGYLLGRPEPAETARRLLLAHAQSRAGRDVAPPVAAG